MAGGGVTPVGATSPATTLTRPPRINKAASKTGHLTFKIGAGLTVPPWFMSRWRTYNKKERRGGGAVAQAGHNAGRQQDPCVGKARGLHACGVRGLLDLSLIYFRVNYEPSQRINARKFHGR